MTDPAGAAPLLAPSRTLGRYALYGVIASGGMASVHFGRLLGAAGFARTVAIKRLHPHLAADPDVASMFIDEARLAARIRHPNVVPILDVVAEGGELFLVMDYVQGESLAVLIRASREAGAPVPLPVVSAIFSGVLHGLHAAHEARSERGEPLGIVHRDVSPQNVIVGDDGVARVLDFGVAKAVGRLSTTRDGQIKGKLSYMAPEQLRGAQVSRRLDVYAASVVLWETLTARRLFRGESEGEVLEQVLTGLVRPPSALSPLVPEALDALTLRGLERDPEARFASAEEMARALERCVAPALASEVGAWVRATAGVSLFARAGRVAEIESASRGAGPPPPPPAAAPGAPAEATLPLGPSAPVASPPADDAPAMPSQVSSLSVSLAKEAGRRSPGRAGWAFGAVLVLGVGVLGGLLLAGARGAPSGPPITAAGQESAAPPASTAAPPGARPEGDPGDAGSAAVPGNAAPSAPAAPSGSPPAAASATAPGPSAARPRGARPPRGPGDDCQIPYTIDATGRRIYKRACL